MNNFMIGMHGKYDFCKFDRDFKKEFYGLEICLFNEEDVKNLIKLLKNKDIERMYKDWSKKDDRFFN